MAKPTCVLFDMEASIPFCRCNVEQARKLGMAAERVRSPREARQILLSD